MLKPRNISFFKIMTAGYISAETYRAIYPRKMFYELSFSDCYKFEQNVREELIALFEDENIKNNLFIIEKVDEAVNLKKQLVINIFDKCVNETTEQNKLFIDKVGKINFLLNYSFISDDFLKNMFFINSDNYITIKEFKNKVFNVYKEFYLNKNTTDVEDICLDVNVVKEECAIIEYSEKEDEQYNIASEAYMVPDLVEVYTRYINYIKSLDSNQIKPFIDFLSKRISSYPTRLRNKIQEIGYRKFYEKFLFGDPSKFLLLGGVGLKTLKDFKQIKQSIINFVISQYENSNFADEEDLLAPTRQNKVLINLSLREKIGETQYLILHNEFQLLMSSCSIRTQNVVRSYSGDFIEDFIHLNKQVLCLKGAGLKTKQELEIVITKIKNIIKNLSHKDFSDKDLSLIVKNNTYGVFIDDFSREFYLERGHMPMIRILESYVKFQTKHDRHFAIFNEVNPLLKKAEAKGISQIATERELTTERVRQICIKAKKQLNSLFIKDNKCFIENCKYPIGFFYDWEYVKNILDTQDIWRSFELENIFKIEGDSLDIHFITFILCQIFPETYSLLGNNKFATQNNNTWKNLYIIKKEILDVFSFDRMFEELDSFVKNSTKTITGSISEFLFGLFSTAWENYDYQLFDKVEQIATKLLVLEKALIPDFDNNFTFIGAKQEEPSDVIYRILQEAEEPLSIDVIFNKFEEVFPSKYKSQDSLVNIIRKDVRFVNLGVEKKISLAEWKHVKIGSIRDLIVEYLSQFDEPQYIDDIVKYIQLYRDTTESSIRTSMRSGDQFEVFEDGYYGLANKSYPKCFCLSEAERNPLKKIELLENFIKEYNHFPFSNKDNREEYLLYVWWSRINQSSNLDENLMLEVERIKQTYKHLPKSKTDTIWFVNCKEYKAFVLKFGRKPQNRNEFEIKLSNWFNKTMADFSDGELSFEKEQAFIELCKDL